MQAFEDPLKELQIGKSTLSFILSYPVLLLQGFSWKAEQTTLTSFRGAKPTFTANDEDPKRVWFTDVLLFMSKGKRGPRNNIVTVLNLSLLNLQIS